MSERNESALYEFEEREIHLRDYFKILLKRKVLILLVLILVTLVVSIKTFKAIPLYTASSDVLVEKNSGRRGLETEYFYWDPEFLTTQSELIRSPNVAARVVDTLGLDERYKRYFFGEEELEPSLLGSIKSSIRNTLSDILAFFTSADQITDNESLETDLDAQIKPLSDRDIIAQIISDGLFVEPVEDTKIVTISYTDQNPAMAQLVTNAVVKAYMDEMLEIKLATSSYSLQWMTQKAAQEREKLERSERALQKYMRDNDLVTVENKLTIYPQKLSEISSQLTAVEAERKELESLLAKIAEAGAVSSSLENIPVFADSQVLKSVREKLYKAEQNIEELSQKYGPKHPVMIKARDELKVLNKEKQFEIGRITAATKNAYELALSNEKNLTELLDETKDEVLNLNEKFIQYSILKRDVDSNRVLYDALETSIKTESVTEQAQSVNIWVVRKAGLPEVPSYPNKRRSILLGLILGMFGGIGLAFLVEYLDNSAKSEVELEDRYGVTVFGTIEKTSGKDDIETHILRKPLSPIAESYRLIRSSLLLSSAGKPPQVIVFTSMNPKEGKTTTTVNLARILAQENRSVLIMDCDLRRPRVHSLFNLENSSGLSEYLTGNTENPHCLSIQGESISLITAGSIPPNPAELLGSEKMLELIVELRAQFDFILIDSPPIQSVTDSLVLSKVADGMMIVVRYGKTTYEQLNAGIKKLNDVKAPLSGFILNCMKRKDNRGYYYGYSSYYASDDD